jgi:GT2 family glycosyltransferase
VKPVVSVISVSYGSSAAVRGCVASLAAQDVPAEVIVVDNASPGNDADNLRDLPVTLLRNPDNVGYGLGNNVGARGARGEFVCVLNPDIVLPPGALDAWVAAARREMAAGAPLGCIAPLLVTRNGSPQKSAYGFVNPVNYWAHHSIAAGALKALRKGAAVRGPARAADHATRRVGWVMGAAMLFPRAAWDAVGGFSPEYFLYAEDTDICRRLWSAGFAVLFAPSVRVVHALGEGAAQRRDVAVVRLFTGILTFLRLHYSPARAGAVRACVVADMILRLALFAPHAALTGNARSAERVKGYREVLRMALRG